MTTAVVSKAEWRCEYCESGTCVVVTAIPNAPHFYVYGPRNENQDHADCDRRKVCEEICDYMNGGPRPKWLDDMHRSTESLATDLDGTSIRATGPSHDCNPPRLHWVEDDSENARNARARLMDDLFFGPGAKPK